MKPSQTIGDYLDALVHPSARRDALTAARHRAFIAPRLIASLAVLACLPIVLAVGGLTTIPEVVLLSWTIVPIATACYLSRSGRYESAHLMSALALAGVATVAAGTSGITSVAAIWLMLIPLEAAVSGSRRVIAAAAVLALGCAALLISIGSAEVAPVTADGPGLIGLALASALLYGTAVALGAWRIACANATLLAAETDRVRTLSENMSDVITRHGADGRILSASANAQEVLGIGAADLVGLGLFDRIVASDRAAYREAVTDAAANGVERNVEFRIRRPKLGDDDCFPWIAMRCKPLPESSGGAVVAVLRDVSMQRARQQELADARAEAERSNAGRSRFLAVVSHELRTPLNAIIGFSEMLANAEEMRVDGARRQEYARLISEAGDHLLAVANGILDVSRLETGEFQIAPEPFEPAPVIGGCCDLLALKAKNAGVVLHSRVPQQLPRIVADPRALRQIVINLVANALKFTNRGGGVTIDAGVEHESLVVSVADTGVGIAPEHFGRLGDPFFQVRGSCAHSHDGNGLGLSIVKGLARLHGGEVEVRSRVGEGTRVSVRLPLDCERRATPAPARKIDRPGESQATVVTPFAASAPTRFKVSLKRSA